MQQEVGIRLKVAAQGLDLIKGLIRDLDAAGVNTDELKQSANALGASLDKIGPKYGATATSAGTASSAMVRSQREVGDGLEQLSNQLRLVQTAFLAITGGTALGGMVKDALTTADAYASLEARLKLAVGSGQALAEAMQGVQQIAIATRSDLDATGTLFTKILDAGKSLGLSVQQALGVTESINQAIQITGGSAESANAAITQLTQGLQGGVLRGDEFNSVMEQAPRLAQALADSLNVTKGKLREMAEAGQLSAETVIQGLRLQRQTLETEFATLPSSVGGAIQNLTTAWTVYIGETSKATGASRSAADAINYLAKNLGPIADRLVDLGQGVAAFYALRLAQHFLGVGEAAKAAAAGVAAAGKEVAATAEGAKTAATAGQKLAGALSSLKTVGLLTLVTNLQDIGTWIGEATAKMFGWGKAQAESEARAKAEYEASKAAARERDEYALKTKVAAEAALGFNEVSRKTVAEFEELRKKGESVDAALVKIAKDMDLGSIKGIQDATTALDVLVQRGKITADQLRETLSAALSGVDLGKFEVNAKAAFDGSEQGARRLKATLDAIAEESLKRAGTSVYELQTGFSSAMNSAMNDTDALAKSLERVGATADDASRLLAKSLDKEIETAKTERALIEVRKRIEELGRQGRLSTDEFAAGLDKVNKKLDESKPGIDSLGEALRTFGLKSRDELQRTADRFRQSWDQIKGSTQVALEDKIKAFASYRDAAIAANGGVESSEVALQGAMLKAKAEVAGLGGAFEQAMSRAKTAMYSASEVMQTVAAGIRSAAASLPQSVLGASGQQYGIGSAQDPHASGPTMTLARDQYPYASTSQRWWEGGSSSGGETYGGSTGKVSPLSPGATEGSRRLADGRWEIVFNLSGSKHTVYSPTKSGAEALVRELEDAARVAQPGG